MNGLYNSIREIWDAQKKVAAIDHPIRCTVHGDERTDVYDILPLRTGEAIDGVLLHDGPCGLKQGTIVVIDDYDFQVMTWEDIEVDDFDWKPYLDWKKKPAKNR